MLLVSITVTLLVYINSQKLLGTDRERNKEENMYIPRQVEGRIVQMFYIY